MPASPDPTVRRPSRPAPATRLVGLAIALTVLLPGPAPADSSRSSPARVSPRAARAPQAGRAGDTGPGARGFVGWRRTATGWSRSGIPGLRLFRGTRAPEGPDLDSRPRSWQPTTLAGEPARLVLEVVPRSASIYVDGDWMGRGHDFTTRPLGVPPGSHELAVGHPEHLPRSVRLELAAGEVRRLVLRLEPEEP